jgi:hypothetical protein
MSNLKTYFKKSVSVCKKSSAYIRAILVLAKALYHAMVGNGNYEVSFTKIGRKWYCNVPGFPKELFEHTLMVGGASNYLEYYSRGENEIVATIRIAKEWEDKFYCGVRLYKVSSTLTGGAFYKVLIYISTLERLESGNPRTSLFYLFNESQNRMEPF